MVMAVHQMWKAWGSVPKSTHNVRPTLTSTCFVSPKIEIHLATGQVVTIFVGVALVTLTKAQLQKSQQGKLFLSEK